VQAAFRDTWRVVFDVEALFGLDGFDGAGAGRSGARGLARVLNCADALRDLAAALVDVKRDPLLSFVLKPKPAPNKPGSAGGSVDSSSGSSSSSDARPSAAAAAAFVAGAHGAEAAAPAAAAQSGAGFWSRGAANSAAQAAAAALAAAEARCAPLLY
jgi:hypothetical protein